MGGGGGKDQGQNKIKNNDECEWDRTLTVINETIECKSSNHKFSVCPQALCL